MLNTLLQRSFRYCYHASMRWQENRRRRHSEESLAALDNHLLADIGLTRVGDRTIAADKPHRPHNH